MASVEHCLYCFETLAAHFDKRRPMALHDILQSWDEYCNHYEHADAPNSKIDALVKQIPALRRVAAQASSSSSSSSAADSPASGASSGSSLPLADDTPATSTSSLAAPPAAPATAETPLFVTWNTVSARSGHASLRGCIGTFEAQDLADGLADFALTSALHDTRFDPIAQRELSSLQVAVTLLTDFEDCADPLDWDLGTHGIRISFTDRGRRYGATYLPDVAVEQGWTKDETLVSLMRKAGWVGNKDKWDSVALDVVRYQGKKQALDHSEFKHWRDWATKKGKA